MSQPLLVFDSGIGGLSVLVEIRRSMPKVDVIYVADDANFPYGDWQADALCGHIVDQISGLIAEHNPQLVVIACNTASTLVLPRLRAAFDIPFVGTVPAIKPAAEMTSDGLISVLATLGTVTRDYTSELIEEFANGASITLVGAPELAQLAEDFLSTGTIDLEALAREIAPCFVIDGDKRTDTIVLGCTHYPFLSGEYERVAPWVVTWLNPAAAIARRTAELSINQDMSGRLKFIQTSGEADVCDLFERACKLLS